MLDANRLLILATLFFSPALLNAETNYGSWAADRFGSASILVAQPDQDPDSDGIKNIREYAFNSDPLAFSPEPEVSSLVVHTSGTTHLHFSFPRRMDATDLRYEVRVAGGPENLPESNTNVVIYRHVYGETPITTGFFSENPNASPPIVETFDPAPVSSVSRRFLQLSISLIGSSNGIEFRVVGNPNNPQNPTAINGSIPQQYLGTVNYAFQMSIFEITNAQYVEFLNAVAQVDPAPITGTDPRPLYNLQMSSNVKGGIVRQGNSPNFSYSTKLRMGNKPVNFVSFFDVCRFCNWLHNGRPSGVQDASTTENGAYDLTESRISVIGNPNYNNVSRSATALYFLPSEEEWYKAAYYEPLAQGAHKYWLYPMRSDLPPTKAIANSQGDISNDTISIANYDFGADWDANQNGSIQLFVENGVPTSVGSGGIGSFSYFGMGDMGGNVHEWIEKRIGTVRFARGGGVNALVSNMWSSILSDSKQIETEVESLGFRVARP